jgi:hypothetical protein
MIDKEKEKIKTYISQYLKSKKFLLEQVDEFIRKFLLKADIKFNYVKIDLENSISICFFQYGDNGYQESDEEVDQINIPYEALSDKEIWIQNIINKKEEIKKTEELLELSRQMNKLKEEQELIMKQSKKLTEQREILENKIKYLGKE